MTNAGIEDVIEIGRQNRPSLYDPWADRPVPLVPRAWRLGVAGRLAADGTELEPLGPVPAVPAEAGAVAVCLLHADLAPAHEQAVAAALRAEGLDVTCSHEVSPEMREYERTVTTVVNAYLRPVCRAYLERLAALAPQVRVMTSAGGLVDVAIGSQRPASLLLSGPAAGVRAAAAVAAANGFPGAISFDMGGTSTDVCLIDGGLPEPSPSLVVGGYPVRLPALAIHTIGAGGGSIAVLDAGGALAVGPRSAGAEPGPACYGRGGTSPTVTDADLVLGRIEAGVAFPGIGRAGRGGRPGGAGRRLGAGGRRGRGRRRQHGRGAAGGVGGAGGGSRGAGAGRVRRGGAAARLRAGRGAGDAGGDRAGAGRGVLGRRVAGGARAGGPRAVVADAARPRRARRRPGRPRRRRRCRTPAAPNRYRFGAAGHDIR